MLGRVLFSHSFPARTTVLKDELVDSSNQPEIIELTVFVLSDRDPRVQAPPEARPLSKRDQVPLDVAAPCHQRAHLIRIEHSCNRIACEGSSESDHRIRRYGLLSSSSVA